jgi:hypothetical protein
VNDRDQALLAVARGAISQALGGPRLVKPAGAWLDEPGSCFVTLTQRGRLRGCIGNIVGVGSVYESVVRNAVSAALRDPRFPPLGRDELGRTRIDISLLSAPRPVPAGSRAELLAALRPGVDGLVLTAGSRSAVFIPSVWSQLPAPEEFLDHLLAKGRFPAGAWPADMRAERFTAEHLEEAE